MYNNIYWKDESSEITTETSEDSGYIIPFVIQPKYNNDYIIDKFKKEYGINFLELIYLHC